MEAAEKFLLGHGITPHLLPFGFFLVRCANAIGAVGIGAPIVLAHYKRDRHVQCAKPIDIEIAY
jgi:hypothetical protein